MPSVFVPTLEIVESVAELCGDGGCECREAANHYEGHVVDGHGGAGQSQGSPSDS